MTNHPSAELRAIVAQVVREVVADVARGNLDHPVSGPSNGPPVTSSTTRSGPGWPQPSGPVDAATRTRTEKIRITGNADLQAFAYRLLDLFENPKSREDIRTGRLKFELAGGVAAAAAPGVVERVERGAVTERKVAAAAAAGTSLILGRRAVLTPLAREKARLLGVLVEKERS
jgi:hypothetical protein